MAKQDIRDIASSLDAPINELFGWGQPQSQSYQHFKQNKWYTPPAQARTNLRQFASTLLSNKHFVKVSKILGANDPKAFVTRLYKDTNGQPEQITKALNKYFSEAMSDGRFGEIYKAYPISFKSLSPQNATAVFNKLPGNIKTKYVNWLVNKMTTAQVAPAATPTARRASQPAQQPAQTAQSQTPPDEELIDRIAKNMRNLKQNGAKTVKITSYLNALKAYGITDKAKAKQLIKQAIEYMKQLELESKTKSISVLAESLNIVSEKPIWHY